MDKKPTRLDKTTPVFNNTKSIRIDQWITIVENNLDLGRVENEVKVKACLNFLRGSAFEMCKKAISKSTSWTEFKKQLLKTFLPVNHYQNIRTTLMELKQTGAYESFAEEFNSLAAQVSDMNEEILLTIFLKGVNPKLRLEIETKEIKYLDEAMDYAARLDQLLCDSSSEEEEISNRREEGKHYRDVKNKPKTDLEEVECFTCGKFGHKSNTCFKRFERTEGKSAKSEDKEQHVKNKKSSLQVSFKDKENKKEDQ